MWFARRGYVAIVVARRGYGRSGGKRDGNSGGCSSRGGSFKDAGDESADDLRAVIKFGQGLPEVDPNTVVSIGISTGGFAQVALSANPPPGLKAAINFAGGRGGDGHEHNCDLGGLVGAYGDFGKSAHKHGDLPMLWIYSENDHWFTPAMAQQFEAGLQQERRKRAVRPRPARPRRRPSSLFAHLGMVRHRQRLSEGAQPAPARRRVSARTATAQRPRARRTPRPRPAVMESVSSRCAIQSIRDQRPRRVGSTHTPPSTSKSPTAKPSTAAKKPPPAPEYARLWRVHLE